jgi:hypothetical protein
MTVGAAGVMTEEEEEFLTPMSARSLQSGLCLPAKAPSALPPQPPLGLASNASEEDVARHEDLWSPNIVTDDIVDDILRLSGGDPQDLCARLEARRYALANRGNACRAAKHLQEHNQWLEEMRPQIESYSAPADRLVSHQGWDRHGHPVCVWNGPLWNSAYYAGLSAEEMVLDLCSVLEGVVALLEASSISAEQAAWRLQKVTILLYLPRGSEPTSWTKVRAILRLFQQQYPERLFRALIFPCSSATIFFWSIGKNFLDEQTTRKIVFLEGGDQSRGILPKALFDHIAPEQLPLDMLGGAATVSSDN